MKPNDLNTALYEKMAAEQDKYRDWLKSQPAAEVLNHAYEYTVREDIVMCMEELELETGGTKSAVRLSSFCRIRFQAWGNRRILDVRSGELFLQSGH